MTGDGGDKTNLLLRGRESCPGQVSLAPSRGVHLAHFAFAPLLTVLLLPGGSCWPETR